MTMATTSQEDSAKSLYERASDTAEHIRSQLPQELNTPKVAIICGSGLNGLADTIQPEPKIQIPYTSIPGFPVTTVKGHDGKLVFGLIGQRRTPVVLLVGRAHFYEGYSMVQVTYALRTCKQLGINTVFITNAAGALNGNYKVGDIVVANDHINFAGMVGQSPLVGTNEDDFGPRFPAMSDAYDLELRRLAHRSWAQIGKHVQGRILHEGVYAYVAGPNYETRAECRMLESLGADLVGMSTVPEVIVARHCDLRILVFSVVTNICRRSKPLKGDDPVVGTMNKEELRLHMAAGRPDHQEVIDAGEKTKFIMQHFVKTILDGLDTE